MPEWGTTNGPDESHLSRDTYLAGRPIRQASVEAGVCESALVWYCGTSTISCSYGGLEYGAFQAVSIS